MARPCGWLRARRCMGVLVGAGVVGVSALVVPAEAVLPPAPSTTLLRTLRTNPFPGTDLAMSDHEGSAYVPRDDSLWLSDDDGRSLYELDATTGALKRRIRGFEIASTPALGGGANAGTTRTDDLQALAYDAARDTLYAFSGTCCFDGLDPTAFRLTRRGGVLQLDSYQPLPIRQVAAAAWNPADGRVYVGADSTLRSYSYAGSSVGPPISVPGLTSIYGMDFTDDGRDLLVARPPSTISRVDWATRTIVPSWTVDLAPYGVGDARAVEVVGDQLWVSDGDDARSPADPVRHAVFVVGLGAATPAPGTPGGPPAPGTGSSTAGRNLVGNPGFERRLRGWAAAPHDGVRLARVRGGHSGSWAGRVTSRRGRTSFGMTDDPGWATTSRSGRYTASLWVRAPAAGTVLKLRLTEVTGKGRVGRATARATLRPSWQRVTVSLPATMPFRSGIDLTVSVAGRPRGGFEVDDARLSVS